MLVKLGIGIEHIIRPHDGGITPGIAAADITFFKYSYVSDSVQTGQVISRRKAMPTTTDDDDIVLFFGFWISPGSGPRRYPLVA